MRYLLSKARPKSRAEQMLSEEKPRVANKENPRMNPDGSKIRATLSMPPIPPMVQVTQSAPPILPCREGAVLDAVNSMWYAQLASQLAWLASPVKSLSEYMPSGDGQASEASSFISMPVSENDSEHDSLESSATRVEESSHGASKDASAGSVNSLENAGTIRRRHAGLSATTSGTSSVCTSKYINPARKLTTRVPTYLRDVTGRPLNALPGVTFTQRYVNPLSTAFGLNVSLRRDNGGRNSEDTSLSGDATDVTSTTDDCSGGRASTSSLGSPWLDSCAVDTPRVGAQLNRRKFGSLRKLGTKLRKSVSLRHSRSVSLDVGAQGDESLQSSPLRQQVLARKRTAASRAGTGNLSASMSLPHGLGVDMDDQSSFGWECRLPGSY